MKPMTVTALDDRVSAYALKFKGFRKGLTGLSRWALNPMAIAFISKRQRDI